MPSYPSLSNVFPAVSPTLDPFSITAGVLTAMFSYLSQEERERFRATAARNHHWSTMMTFLAEDFAKKGMKISPWAIMPDTKLAIAIREDSIPIFAVNLGDTLTIRTFLNKDGVLDWRNDGVLVDAKFKFPTEIYGLRVLNTFYLSTVNLKASPAWSNIYPSDGLICTGPNWPPLSAPLTEQWEFILHKNPWGEDLTPGLNYKYSPTMAGRLSERNVMGLAPLNAPLPALKNLWERNLEVKANNENQETH